MRPLACEVIALASALPAGPLEVADLLIQPCHRHDSTIDAFLTNPSAHMFLLGRMPHVLPNDQPLEIALRAATDHAGGRAAASTARSISTHSLVIVVVETMGTLHSLSAQVSVRPSGDSWVARALLRPAGWIGASSVTVISLSILGRPLHFDGLPVSLRVGFNHTPAPEGAVIAAARSSNLPALRALLDSGCSTEEFDKVR